MMKQTTKTIVTLSKAISTVALLIPALFFAQYAVASNKETNVSSLQNLWYLWKTKAK
jgi:hypothetical protein